MKGVIFDKKNIVVTGGAGFLGSHLCDELVKKHKVICIDNFISGSERNIDHLLSHPNFEFIKHDVTQPLDLSKLSELKKFEVEFQGIQEIYHLAAPSSPQDYKKFPLETVVTNGLATEQTLRWAQTYQARYLFTSTGAIYGSPLSGQMYFREDYWGFVDPVGLRSGMQEGKRYAEALVMTYRRAHKLQTKIARVFTTYGPRMVLDDGRLIPDMIKAALNNEPLRISGQADDVYSFCYVTDMVDGLIKLMADETTEIANIGSPYKVTVAELAATAQKVSGSQQAVEYTPQLDNFIYVGLPDITRAKEALGWFPLTELANGLRLTFDAMKADRIMNLTK